MVRLADSWASDLGSILDQNCKFFYFVEFIYLGENSEKNSNKL